MIGRRLRDEDLIRTEDGTPEHLNMYADDVCGAGAIARAVKDLLGGGRASFAICEREPPHVVPLVKEVINWAPMPGRACIRWCGEGGNPDGAGSQTLHGCGSVYTKGNVADLDPLRVCAVMSATLFKRGRWIFRLAETTDGEPTKIAKGGDDD